MRVPSSSLYTHSCRIQRELLATIASSSLLAIRDSVLELNLHRHTHFARIVINQDARAVLEHLVE